MIRLSKNGDLMGPHVSEATTLGFAPAERTIATAAELRAAGIVLVSVELLDFIDRTLAYYGNLTTYQGERTGGVLAGCPRGPDPTPDQLVIAAHEARDRLRTAIGEQRHLTPEEQATFHKAFERSVKFVDEDEQP